MTRARALTTTGLATALLAVPGLTQVASAAPDVTTCQGRTVTTTGDTGTDGLLAYVQNGLMNLEGINDGSITLVDLENMEAVGSIDTFKAAGFTVNMIEGMPDDPRAHTH